MVLYIRGNEKQILRNQKFKILKKKMVWRYAGYQVPFPKCGAIFFSGI